MRTFLNQLFRLILSVGVFLYILFEELIWDQVAEPIYNYVRSLRLLHAIENRVKTFKPISILILFLALFIQVEALGIVALGLIAQGNPVLGISLYLAKLPVAAFTFWLFKVCKDILMTFAWFKYSYESLETGIALIKASAIHQNIIALLVRTKTWLKHKIQSVKAAVMVAKTTVFGYLGFDH